MKIGDCIAERFSLTARAGSGGMGALFRALDRQTGEVVAFKTWLPRPPLPSTDGESSTERIEGLFEREARALGRVQHPAVVRYIAHGVTPELEPYLVMSWVPGEDLAHRLLRQPLGLGTALELCAKLTLALNALHSAGIVHRDVKPANIMLENADPAQPILVDFGVARSVHESSVTRSGVRIGTPRYMAPEQIRDPRGVDGRADVFALGSVLFEAVTQKPAFPADDALGAIAQILLDEPPDPRRCIPDLPADVALLTRALLARDRAKRPLAEPALAERLTELAVRYRHWSARDRSQAARADNVKTVQVVGSVGLEPRGAGAAQAPGVTFVAEPASRYPVPVALEGGAQRELIAPPSARPHAVAPAMRYERGELIGRDAELRELQTSLQSERRVLLLWGAAGIGKTHLARALLESAAPETSLFVDLAQARDAHDVRRLVLAEAGASNIGADDAQRALLKAVAGLQQTLVVLDHAEHLADAVQQLVLALLPLGTVRFLVTSRERLRLPDCVAFELGPLPVRGKVELRTLLGLEHLALSTSGTRRDAGVVSEVSIGARLLLRRIEELEPQFAPTQRDLYLCELCATALEGIPLALELAALRVSILGLEGVVARLTEQLTLLGEPEQQTSKRRQRTMQDALTASWELLTLAERELLMQCSVFRGGFTATAAQAVLAPASTNDSVLDVLQGLRDKSLIFAGPSKRHEGEPRLFTFAVVREYASTKLAQSGRLPELCARHARHYIERFAKLASLDRSEWTRARLGALEAEGENLIAAVEHSLSEGAMNVELALEALLVLEPLLALRGPLPEFQSLLKRALDAGASRGAALPAQLLARVRRVRGRLLATAGMFEEAVADLELALQQSAPDSLSRGLCHLELGVVHHLARRLPQAKEQYDAALLDLRRGSEPRAEARCLGNLGAAMHDLGDLPQAATYYGQAIARLEELGERRERANFLSNLGVLEQELGRFERARKRLNEAVALLSQLGDARLCGIALGNLGSLEAELGAWDAALACYERALEMLRPVEDRCSEALCLGRLAAACATLERLEAAREYACLAFERLGSEGASDRDVAHAETLRLLYAFLDLAAARAELAQDPDEAERRLDAAEARIAQAEQLLVSGIPLLTVSDDARCSLRLLKPRVEELRAQLSGSSP